MSEKKFCRACLCNNKVVLYEDCNDTHYFSITNEEGSKQSPNDYHFKSLDVEEVKEQLKYREDLVVSTERNYRDAKRKYEKMLDEYRRITLSGEE